MARSLHGISMRSPRPISEYEHRDMAAEGVPADWKRVGSQWTACEDPMFPVDKAVVRAIRELDPDFVPLWIYTEHESEGGARVIRCHHAIGWRLKTPHKKHQDRQILWPVTPGSVNYGMGGYPVYVEKIVEGAPSAPTAAFKPLSWEDHDDIKRGIWWQKHEMPLTPEEEAAQIVAAEEDRKAKAEAAFKAELSYRFDNASRFAGRHFDNLGSADIQAWGAPREDKKPFVEVHHS